MDDYAYSGGISSTFGFGGIEFGDEQIIDPGQLGMQIETQGDHYRGVTPEFRKIVVHDKTRSDAEGRRCCKEIEIVLLRVVGDRLNEISHPLSTEEGQAIKRRFRIQYENWKANREGEAPVDGTPLNQWPVVNGAQVQELASLNIYTVEGLGEVADANMHRWPDLRSLRDKAVSWLRQARDGGETIRLQTELQHEREERANEREAMNARMDALTAQIEELSKRRGPGRPPKEAVA